MHPVINLKVLNGVVRYRHFRMEGIHLLRETLLQGKWMAKINLKDAYLRDPIAMESMAVLCFRWNDQMWQFTCLPLGLSSAP